MDKLRFSEAFIVEGKYDKIRLDSLINALVIATGGFRVFRDREMRAFIHKLAHSCGIVVLTDADAAGFRIRACVTEAARGGSVIHAYIPDILGKERRKTHPGAEGKLGVEGMDTPSLLEAFRKAGILPCAGDAVSTFTPYDLYALGLSGGADSGRLRGLLCRRLGLPQRISQSSLLPVLGRLVTREELEALVRELREEP